MGLDLKYSIDKIKLFINGVKIGDIQVLMDRLSVEPNVKKTYENNSITSCRYNYILQEPDITVFSKTIKGNTFYLGIEPNWTKDKNKNFRDIVIEYNPNKLSLKDFNALNSILPIDEYKTEIMSMDIAVDIYDYHITDLLVYKNHGNKYECKIFYGQLETIYIGAFGENGHIRIYNKAKEQKISDDMKWTRFEVTYKKLGFMDIRDTEVVENTKLPILKVIDKNIAAAVDGTEKYILLTSLDNIDLLNLLGRRMKKKILEYHKNLLKEVPINIEQMKRVYKDFKII